MIKFTSRVLRDPDGYQWVLTERFPKGHPRHDPHPLLLVPKNLERITLIARRHEAERIPLSETYDPFRDEPALFRIFAGLEPSEEAILAFANQYGDIAPLLLIGWVGGSYLREWKKAVLEMRQAVEKADRFLAKRQLDQAHVRDAAAAARLVNEFLAELQVSLCATKQGTGVAINIVATNLRQVLQLQLVAAVAEEHRFRDCDFCGRPFELKPHVNRADRVFCSANCRVKAYQRRRRHASELASQGMSLRAIAEELKTDLKTAKGWIKAVAKEESNAPKATRKR